MCLKFPQDERKSRYPRPLFSCIMILSFRRLFSHRALGYELRVTAVFWPNSGNLPTLRDLQSSFQTEKKIGPTKILRSKLSTEYKHVAFISWLYPLNHSQFALPSIEICDECKAQCTCLHRAVGERKEIETNQYSNRKALCAWTSFLPLVLFFFFFAS